MQVHKIEGDATLQVAVYMAESHLASNVLDAKVRQVGLRDRLVYRLVFADAPLEIRFRLLTRHVFVVRVSGRYL